MNEITYVLCLDSQARRRDLLNLQIKKYLRS